MMERAFIPDNSGDSNETKKVLTSIIE